MTFLSSLRSFMALVCLVLFLVVFFTSSVAKANEAFFNVRNGIPNSQYFLKLNQTGNQYLFFIGSDLLDGPGLANPNNRWSAQMTRCLKSFFPDSNIIETRHPQPGGSWFAQYRTSGGQAVFGEVICSGHLVVLELAVGDQGVDQIHAQRQIEGLIRQVYQYRATHSIIVVYALTPELLAAYREGKEPEYVAWSEKIMENYGIPSLNLAKFVSDKIAAGEISAEDFSKDGVHPTDAGQKLYGDAISEFMNALIEATPIPEKPARIKLPEPLFPETNANGRIVAYERTQFSDGWKSGIESPIKPFRHLLTTEKAAETVTLQFTGTDVGLIDVSGPDSMDLEYSLDGGSWKKVPAQKTTGPFVMRAIPFEEMLENTEHSLTLRTCGAGTARIGGLLINGTIPDVYAGLTPLEKIDAIYANMDPMTYVPEKDRFRYLPKTMERLKNGDSLRMVLLGDSIIGNTCASNFDLLMGRKYPNCDIKKIPSTRSSTGCAWYQHENRVQAYVTDKNPDFLIIGGISNGLDPEAVRSVIRQVRAQNPGLEILFITPVFGALRDDHIARWSFIPAEGSFRAGMKKVCEEEKCAFFDMTAPWWKYVQESGKTYGWFMGDAVHANARGCQIIGRLLEIYFDSEK